MEPTKKPPLPPYEEQRLQSLQNQFEAEMERGVEFEQSEASSERKPSYAELTNYGQERLDRAKANVRGFFDRTRAGFGSFFGRIKNGGEKAAAVILSAPEITQRAKEQVTEKAIELREDAIAGIGAAYDAASETVHEASRELSQATREVVDTTVDALGNGYKAVEGTVVGAYSLFYNKFQQARERRRLTREMPARMLQLQQQMNAMQEEMRGLRASLAA